jgi:hypothetical protein
MRQRGSMISMTSSAVIINATMRLTIKAHSQAALPTSSFRNRAILVKALPQMDGDDNFSFR